MSIDTIENLINGLNLLSKPRPETHWLVENLIPYSILSALVGESGTGKSTFLRQLALAIIQQKSTFLGYKLDVRSGNVLYVSTEDGKNFTYDSLCKQLGYTDEMFNEDGELLIHQDERLANVWFLFDNLNIIDKAERIVESKSVDLIIVDAYSDIFVGDMNQSNQVRTFLTDYSKIADHYNCAVLFMHHFGKGIRTNAKHKILGSSGFEQKMRSILSLSRKSDQVLLKIVKTNYLSKMESSKVDSLTLNENLLFEKISTTIDQASSTEIKPTKVEILLADYHELLHDIKYGPLTYKKAISLLLEDGFKVSEATVNEALKQLD